MKRGVKRAEGKKRKVGGRQQETEEYKEHEGKRGLVKMENERSDVQL